MPADTYKAQRRGGKGIVGLTTRESDFVRDPIFNVDVPQHVDGVSRRVLNPRDTWADKEAYDKTARRVAKMFVDNAAEKYPDMAPEVRAAGPVVE